MPAPLLALEFASGTLAQWLTIASVVIAAWLLKSGGGGTALASLKTANEVLERRVHDLERQGKLDAATIGELRARTDVTLALRPLLEEVTRHEHNAQERFGKQLAVLGLIAERLGAESETGGRPA